MRMLLAIPMLALAACGGDTPSADSAAVSAANAASRDAAQESRIDNPDALACIRANSSDGEWAIIAGQDANAEAMLQSVLRREGTVRCFNDNNVTVYL